MEYTREEDNPWAKEAPRDEAAEKVSAEIDEQLRRDRIESLRTCQVLVISPPSDEEERKILLQKIVGQDTPHNEEVEDHEVSRDDVNFRVSSFATPLKKKLIRLKLSNADPSLLVYAVSLAPKGEVEIGATIKHLESSLEHCLLSIREIGGSLESVAVQLVVTNSGPLSQLCESGLISEHASKASKWFSKTEPNVEAFIQEFESAIKNFQPQTVKTLEFEQELGIGLPETENLTQEFVNQFVEIQQNRIREAQNKSLKSEFIKYPKKRDTETSTDNTLGRTKEKHFLLAWWLPWVVAIVAAAAYFALGQRISDSV